MQYKFSTFIGGIAFGVLLILASQVTAAAQSRTPETDEWRMRQVLEAKNRSYQASRLTTSVLYDSGVPRNAKELSKYESIASKLKSFPEELVMEFNQKLSWFSLTHTQFPLTFNKFLLAKVISSNLEATHPDITTDVLLSALVKRKGYIQTMRNLGLSPEEAKVVEKTAKQEIKDSKR
jgi:hypothetical protein